MDPTYPIALAITGTVLIALLYLLWKPRDIHDKRSSCRSNKAPEAAGAWPIIGHLHLLAGQGLPHVTLGAMADEYGPAFVIRLGTRKALVVSSWEVAKECFTTNDRAFSNRPHSIAVKIMGYNNSMFGFAPYGQYWRELRKIVILELLSSRRLELLKSVWNSEIDLWIKELYDTCRETSYEQKKDQEGGPEVPVLPLGDMRQWFADLTMNIIVRLVAGKRYFGKKYVGVEEAEARRCQKALGEFMRLVGLFMVEDALPFLTWLDPLGYQRQMKSTARELDSLLQGWLQEHKLKKKSKGGCIIDTGSKLEEQDFMDVMLSIVEDSTISGRDADTIIKSTCLSMILGGSDTTAVTLTWALSLLLNHEQVLKKAQDELDAHVGRDRHVEESDLKNLVYLQAIIKEALRLYPAGPLGAPLESLEDTVVAGYHFPAGTRLILNLTKIQRDPSIWPDPLEFRPERFLTTHKGIDVWGQHFELLPFGSGRRSCPGISFAFRVAPLALARLLQGFDMTTPGGAPVDMTDSNGLTNAKATPLGVVLTPRLPLNKLL